MCAPNKQGLSPSRSHPRLFSCGTCFWGTIHRVWNHREWSSEVSGVAAVGFCRHGLFSSTPFICFCLDIIFHANSMEAKSARETPSFRHYSSPLFIWWGCGGVKHWDRVQVLKHPRSFSSTASLLELALTF